MNSIVFQGVRSILIALVLSLAFAAPSAAQVHNTPVLGGAFSSSTHEFDKLCFWTDEITARVCVGDEVIFEGENVAWHPDVRGELFGNGTNTFSYTMSDPAINIKLQSIAKTFIHGANDLLLSYDGWQYDSNRPGSFYIPGDFTTRETPGFLDDDRARLEAGPAQLSRGSGSGVSDYLKATSLETLNLGIDDEIDKLAMPVFRPRRKLRKEYSNNELLRDEFLFLFPTVRGVAFLTLAYLDKTVSAGLATVHDDIQAHVRNQLLEQIAWATKESTSPEYQTLFRDLDEKIEYCLRSEWKTDTPILEKVGSNRSPIPTLYDEIPLWIANPDPEEESWCGPPPPPDSPSDKYDFCVCWAQLESRMNRGTFNASRDETVSAVHRAMLGKYAPRAVAEFNIEDGAILSGDHRIAGTVVFVENFVDIYGDVHFSSQGGDGTSEGAANIHGGAVIKKQFFFPLMSIPQRITFMRNGCRPGREYGAGWVFEECDDDNEGTGTNDVELGVCPATEWLIQNWPITPDDADWNAARIRFAEASVGKQLTARDIENWLVVSGEHAPFDTTPGWEIQGHLRRIVDVFCDVSAVSAVKKVHADMKQRAETYMAANQYATDYEKALVRSLMDRVERELAAAEDQVRAEDEPTYRLVTAGAESERKKMGHVASFTEGVGESAVWKSRVGGTTSFGNQGSGCNGAGC